MTTARCLGWRKASLGDDARNLKEIDEAATTKRVGLLQVIDNVQKKRLPCRALSAELFRSEVTTFLDSA